jgi:hypothetical protein
MKSILNQFDTKSVNTSDLTPHAVNRDKNIKLLKELDARNNARIASHKYKFTDMVSQLKSRPVIEGLNNPAAYATDGNSNPNNQRMELTRMAKITASMARDKKPFIINDYENTKHKFISDYSKKINEFRMAPTIYDIFEQFKNPSYHEKGYDRDYLGQGTSDNYLRSITSANESKALKKTLESVQAKNSTDMGKIHSLLSSNLNAIVAMDNPGKLREVELNQEDWDARDFNNKLKKEEFRMMRAIEDKKRDAGEEAKDDIELEKEIEVKMKSIAEQNVEKYLERYKDYTDKDFKKLYSDTNKAEGYWSSSQKVSKSYNQVFVNVYESFLKEGGVPKKINDYWKKLGITSRNEIMIQEAAKRYLERTFGIEGDKLIEETPKKAPKESDGGAEESKSEVVPVESGGGVGEATEGDDDTVTDYGYKYTHNTPDDEVINDLKKVKKMPKLKALVTAIPKFAPGIKLEGDVKNVKGYKHTLKDAYEAYEKYTNKQELTKVPEGNVRNAIAALPEGTSVQRIKWMAENWTKMVPKKK